VVLNTPGFQDGGFLLEVNGRVTLDLSDVFYREDVEPIGFKGIFFRYVLSVFTTRRVARLNSSTLWAVSTFFGGHDKEWATPKDQFVWFKDFELSINDLE